MMLKLIYSNGTYTVFTKDTDNGQVSATFSEVISNSSPISAEELFDDITVGMKDGARLEVAE